MSRITILNMIMTRSSKLSFRVCTALKRTIKQLMNTGERSGGKDIRSARIGKGNCCLSYIR